MKTRPSPRKGRDPLVNASSGANGASRKDILVSCGFCLKRFKPKSRLNRFCGPRCRLLFWAARELAHEREAGGAKGVQHIIARMK